jgi:hypothetical protein
LATKSLGDQVGGFGAVAKSSRAARRTAPPGIGVEKAVRGAARPIARELICVPPSGGEIDYDSTIDAGRAFAPRTAGGVAS